MPLSGDTLVVGHSFAAATGVKTGANLEDLVALATPASGSEMVDQATLEDYADGGLGVRRFRLKDGALAASAAGRAKMAAGFFTADATGLGKFADGFLTADATGRAKMADGFVTAPQIGALPRFSMHKNGVDQSIPATTWTKIAYAVADQDTESGCDFVNNRYVCQVDGSYAFAAVIRMKLVSGYAPSLSLRLNGADYCVLDAAQNGPTNIGVCLAVPPIALVATDYVELWVYSSAPIARNLDGTAAYSRFGGHWVGL